MTAHSDLTEQRAERLRVALSIYGADTTLDPQEALRACLPALNECDLALMETMQDEDFALCNAVLEVERELREREFAAVETLVALVPPGGEIREVLHLPVAQRLRAIDCALDCGWVR